MAFVPATPARTHLPPRRFAARRNITPLWPGAGGCDRVTCVASSCASSPGGVVFSGSVWGWRRGGEKQEERQSVCRDRRLDLRAVARGVLSGEADARQGARLCGLETDLDRGQRHLLR